jgi:hypothetical protein
MRIFHLAVGLFMMSFSFASNAAISIEMSKNKQQYRFVIDAVKEIEINLLELERPSAGLAPRNAFVAVKDKVGN